MKYTVALSQADIQSIINGREVEKILPDGSIVTIRQSYTKDMAAPVLLDRFNVRDSDQERLLEDFRAGMQNSFLGGAK